MARVRQSGAWFSELITAQDGFTRYLTIRMPWPPSVNHYWRQFRGRAIVSQEGRKYRVDAANQIIDAIGASIIRWNGPLKVVIQTRQPDHRRRDLDNIPKAVLDALTFAGAYPDDSWIDDLRIVRGQVCSDSPGIYVTISPLDDRARGLADAG